MVMKGTNKYQHKDVFGGCIGLGIERAHTPIIDPPL
jgi:hypothetical protein